MTNPQRKYIPNDLVFENWDSVKQFYEDLVTFDVQNIDALKEFLAKRSELDKIVEQAYRWFYVQMTCDTENEQHKKAYENFISETLPEVMKVSNELNLKVYRSPAFDELDADRFFIYKRGLKNAIELYREENIALIQEEQLKAQEFGSISGQMTIEHNGADLTLSQAAVFLQEKDRNLRKEIYEKIQQRRLQDKDKLNRIFADLIQIRHKMAQNAGFANYRDYKLAELGRFDYDVAACEAFHHAVETVVVPVVNKIYAKRKENLGLDALKPYDLDVDETGGNPLKPYSEENEFIEKSIACLNDVDAFFAECLRTMQQLHFLDLSSRKGKAPGGYNMTLPEIGIPFIFMNGAGTQRDVETMVHEAGHAVHTFLMRDLTYNFDGEITSEIAELASMSMEFFTHDGLSRFYAEADKNRAIQTHLKGAITMLPWIALIDKFQHWIYTRPQHTAEERTAVWNELYGRFSSNVTDWSGCEQYKNIAWQKQLHLFEVPFYYIEYGIAQLGALAMYRNYLANKPQTIQNYKKALSLGYTQTIPAVYQTAGVAFDFSTDYVRSLVDFAAAKIG
jgi:oligoendopeptidase F